MQVRSVPDDRVSEAYVRQIHKVQLYKECSLDRYEQNTTSTQEESVDSGRANVQNAKIPEVDG
jgi:hypothetical protein